MKVIPIAGTKCQECGEFWGISIGSNTVTHPGSCPLAWIDGNAENAFMKAEEQELTVESRT